MCMFSSQKALLFLGDIIMLAASFCVMALVRFDVGAQGTRIWYQIQVFALLFGLWLIVFFIFELYNLRNINPNPRTIGLLVAAMALNIVIGIVLFYFISDTGIAPKTNLVILAGSAFIFLIAWRRAFYFLFTKQFARRIILVGTTHLIKDLVEELARHRHFGTVVGTFDTIPSDIHADLVIADGIHPEILLRFSQNTNTEAYSVAQAYETLFGKIPLDLMTHEKAVHIMTKHTNSAQHVLYRLCEIIIAVSILVAISPVLLIAILARFIEDGSPVFYNQLRVGKAGKPFKLYKIRSMSKDAETDGAAWAKHRDTRITPVGRILRKTHLDEVPQMWNIIKGDLALIGPRAERPEFVATLEQAIPYYYLRHAIKPGFTGWAQIKYRYARTIEDSREKFEYDLYYLKNKHPLLDIGIVLKTIQIIFTH